MAIGKSILYIGFGMHKVGLARLSVYIGAANGRIVDSLISG